MQHEQAGLIHQGSKLQKTYFQSNGNGEVQRTLPCSNLSDWCLVGEEGVVERFLATVSNLFFSEKYQRGEKHRDKERQHTAAKSTVYYFLTGL